MNPVRWGEALRSAATRLLERASERLPDLAGALVLILAGWALAALARAAVRRLFTAALARLRLRLHPGGGEGLAMDRTLPGLAGGFIFWAVMAVFAVAAADTLGMAGMGELLAGLARQLPQVLVGLLVAFAGVALGGLVHELVLGAASRSGLAQGPALARAAQVSVIVLAAVMAADQAGIHSTFLMIALPVALGAVLGGAALAFALGSRAAVGNILAAYHLRGLYEVGQRVRIGGVEGRIERMTATTVVLQGADGRVSIPAKLFSEQVSVLLSGGEGQ